MGKKLTKALDGKRLNYTYAELGTVIVQFNSGKVGFEWIDGPLKGETGEGFDYRARLVGEGQFL